MDDQDGKGNFDLSDYKVGPRPFVDKFDSNHPKHSSQNVDLILKKLFLI